MGRMGAEGMSEQVREGNVDLGGALSWHLRANHYPPLPEGYIDVAEAALEKAQDAGPWEEGFDFPEVLDEEIELPADLNPLPRESREDEEGKVFATVRTLIEIMHLESFIDFEGSNDFPQTEEDARTCVHGNRVWLGHECGECEDAGEYVWAG